MVTLRVGQGWTTDAGLVGDAVFVTDLVRGLVRFLRVRNGTRGEKPEAEFLAAYPRLIADPPPPAEMPKPARSPIERTHPDDEVPDDF